MFCCLCRAHRLVQDEEHDGNGDERQSHDEDERNAALAVLACLAVVVERLVFTLHLGGLERVPQQRDGIAEHIEHAPVAGDDDEPAAGEEDARNEEGIAPDLHGDLNVLFLKAVLHENDKEHDQEPHARRDEITVDRLHIRGRALPCTFRTPHRYSR